MFSITTSPTHPPYHLASSPLTPRSINITPAWPSQYCNSASTMSKHTLEPPHPFAVQTISFPLNTPTTTIAPDFPQTPISSSRRRIDPRRALTQSAEQKRGQRRESYMKKVKEQRDEGRWDARGDQILYDSYVNERRAWEQWEQEQARREHLDIEQCFDEGLESQQVEQDDHELPGDEIEDLLEKERDELEALVAMHEEAPEGGEEMEKQDGGQMPGLVHQQSSPYLGPDDGDFEELMLDDIMDIS